jgi:hypothetical protein
VFPKSSLEGGAATCVDASSIFMKVATGIISGV